MKTNFLIIIAILYYLGTIVVSKVLVRGEKSKFEACFFHIITIYNNMLVLLRNCYSACYFTRINLDLKICIIQFH